MNTSLPNPSSANKALIIILMLAAILSAISPHARADQSVDIIEPEDGKVTSSENISFQVSHNLTSNASCTVMRNHTLAYLYSTQSGVETFNLTAAQGSWRFNVTCDTLSGDISDDISIIVDTTAPDVVITPYLDNSNLDLSNATLTLQALSDENATLTLRMRGQSGQYSLQEDMVKTIILSVEEGIITLNMSAADLAGNMINSTFTFNVTISSSTCYDGEMDGDEDGIDCGGSCGACIPYEIDIEEDTYDLNEQVDITVVGRPESTHNITIVGTDFSFSTIGDGIAGYFLFPEKAGVYTATAIFSYLGNTQTRSTTFEVINMSTLQVEADIDASKTKAAPGESITFTASASGGIPPYRYSWDFNEDWVTDSTAGEQAYVYTTPGQKEVRLIVNDSHSITAEISIFVTIKNRYSLILAVRENNTDAVIRNASVEFGDVDYTTDDDGNITISEYEGTHLLSIEADEFREHNEDYELTQNASKTVYLRRVVQDGKPPKITVYSPYDDQIFESGPVQVKYSVEDGSETRCRQGSGEYANSLNWKGDYYTITNGSENIFTIQSLSNGKNYWTIRCVDLYDNTREVSGSFIIQGGEAPPTAEDTGSTANIEDDEFFGTAQNLTERARVARDRLSDYGEKEAKIIDAMKLREQLNQLSKEASNIQRDLFNLNSRRMNDQERAEERERIVARAIQMTGEIVTDIKVEGINTFIRYASEDEIINATLDYINATSPDATDDEIGRWIELNKAAQQGLTASSTLYHVRLTYLNEEVSDITLIIKEFVIKDNTTGLAVLEVIPKDVIASAKEITLITDADVVLDDPILKVADGERQLIYHIPGFADLDSAERIRSIMVVEEKPNKHKKSFITGFLGLSSKNVKIDLKTSLLASVILSLLVYLVFFHFEILSVDRVKRATKHIKDGRAKHLVKMPFASKDVKRIREKLQVIQEHVEGRRLEKANEELTEAKQDWSILPDKDKEILLFEMDEVELSLNDAIVLTSVKKAQRLIAGGEIGSAKSAFERLRSAYPKASASIRFENQPELSKIAMELNKSYIGKLMQEAHQALEIGAIASAKEKYTRLKTIYTSGSRDLQLQAHGPAKELHAKIARYIMQEGGR